MNRARLEIHCDETALDGITGKGVGVAVLDTGIYIHEDLKGKILGFKDFVHGKKLPYDDNGHGTHVSAMIAGSGAASGGIFKGIAPGSRILGIKVLERKWICSRCDNGASLDQRTQKRIWNTYRKHFRRFSRTPGDDGEFCAGKRGKCSLG